MVIDGEVISFSLKLIFFLYLYDSLFVTNSENCQFKSFVNSPNLELTQQRYVETCTYNEKH